jgi:3alpha(or 20beta)-hydroxysteroid dehydrogenase
MKRLENKVALITGAAGGIGAASAKRLIDEGASVVLSDINQQAGMQLAESLGEQAIFIQHDVSDKSQWQNVIEQSRKHFGQLNILVNNAGVCIYNGLLDYTEEEIHRMLNINLLSVMLGTQVAAPVIAESSNSGAIINMSSAEGLSTVNGLSAYIASKWAIRGYTKAAAMELGPLGIRVNSIHPGGVDTPMANPTALAKKDFDQPYKKYPAQRGAQAEQIASVVAFLASEDASHCMGAEIAVDGGMTAGKYIDFLPGAPN